MKRVNWKLASLAQLFVLISACSYGVNQVTDDGGGEALLFEETRTDRHTLDMLASRLGVYPSLSALLTAPSSQTVWLVNIKPALLGANNSELAVKMPEQGIVRFNLRRSSDVAGMHGWIGDVSSDRRQRYTSSDEVDFDPFSWISLVRDDDQVVGNIHVAGQRYRLEPTGAGQHVLIKVDETKMPPDGNFIAPSGSPQVEGAKKSAQSPHSTIRVMFVTTNERRSRSPHYRTELVQALQDANQYLINSRVPLTYELAGFFDADYSEDSKNQWVMLKEMANPDSALGAQVATWRTSSGADLVSLYNVETSICGNAYGWSRKETGFNTISCTVSLAHELGHNLGAGHGLEGTDPTQSYNHGYRHYSPNFHTRQVTSHGAIPYFSNPRLTYENVALGTVQNHDVARQFDEYRETVENFYPPMPPYLINHGHQESGKTTCLTTVEQRALVARACPESAEPNPEFIWKRIYINDNFTLSLNSSNKCVGSFDLRGDLVLTRCTDPKQAPWLVWTPFFQIDGSFMLGWGKPDNGFCLAVEAAGDRVELTYCDASNPLQRWRWSEPQAPGQQASPLL